MVGECGFSMSSSHFTSPRFRGKINMAAWNKLYQWQELGVWEKLHQVLLEKLHQADKLDWQRAIVDSSSVRAIRGGEATGKNPTDRAKKGSKHHVLSEAKGLPLAQHVTGANVHDSKQLEPLVDAVPPLKGKRGRPRRRPRRVQGDRGYDSQPHRNRLRKRGIKPVLAKRRTPHGSGLGKTRWPVERLLSWLHQFRRLRIRDERLQSIHQAFLTIAASLICFAAI
jgi:transposase